MQGCLVTESSAFERKLAELQRDFDHSFATAPVTELGEFEDVLTVRVGGDPYALRAPEISGLFAGRRVVPLPTRRADLLGMAGIRSALVPVYGLSLVLGYAPSEVATPWIALCDKADPVGLAFEDLEGFVRVPRTAVHARTQEGSTWRHVTNVVRIRAETRPLVDVGLILQALRGGTSTQWPRAKGAD
jgi:chemotaxis signal transduction protein